MRYLNLKILYSNKNKGMNRAIVKERRVKHLGLVYTETVLTYLCHLLWRISCGNADWLCLMWDPDSNMVTALFLGQRVKLQLFRKLRATLTW